MVKKSTYVQRHEKGAGTMSASKETVMAELAKIELPDGGDLVSRDMVRAVTVEGDQVRFVIEAPSAEMAKQMAPVEAVARRAVESLDGVAKASVILTAHGPAEKKAPPPDLKIGGHPKPQQGPMSVPGVDKIIAIGSGKGGVGKSTVSSNLAVALARKGLKVGLLDADIYGPSQPKMMGNMKRPGATPDGEKIVPLDAHGVRMMSIGSMVDADQALIWRGPMLMGALQQLLGQVDWAPLDILIIDMPPGTGDVQLTLGQKTEISGAIIVSTPQDVALIDARKAINMFQKLKTPILGMIENMSFYKCPKCGDEAHIFGHGGVETEAKGLGVPLLAALPIDLDTRLGGDSGAPIASGEGPIAEAYLRLADQLIESGIA